ncbi:MAG: NAD(P)/FAD-dependent oxidoreductase [Polyangiaceae bacterium]
MTRVERSPREWPRVVIVGAGMSGIAMGKRLRAAGVDFALYEKAARLGGTWRENTYPGLTCDVPAHYYAYRDEPNADWTSVFAPGGEIQAYLERVAAKHDLLRSIQFGTEIVSGVFEGGHWRLRTADGASIEADVLVCATGVLHQPRTPAIPGLETFAGKAFHSARWDPSATTRGARVGVLGSGSTGVQITVALAPEAGHLTLFQRTPQWVIALPNVPFPALFRLAQRTVPGLDRALYAVSSAAFDALGRAPIEPGLPRELIGWLVRRALASVRDPELREKLTPKDVPMCKRLINSSGFYGAVQRDNVSVVTAEVARACPEGIVTADGQLHPLDVLVLATGFHAHAYMRPMSLTGPDGKTLAAAWEKGPRAHNTTMVPGLPNLFALMGPNSPIGNASLVPIAEAQADYVVSWLDRMRDRGIAEVEPTEAATDGFYEEVKGAMNGTVWVTGCDSWYLTEERTPVLWPWTLERFRERLGRIVASEFIERALPTDGRSSAAVSP